VKQGIGKAVGNDRLRAEGAAQETKGKAQKVIAGAKSSIKDAANKGCRRGQQEALAELSRDRHSKLDSGCKSRMFCLSAWACREADNNA
jgi:uncharacterized protein YjbJ (UPF0337 family)